LPDARVRACIISPGVAHAVPRTVAIAPYLDEIHFIDVLGTADRRVLEDHAVHYHTLREAGKSPYASVQLRDLLKKIRPDVIGCHYGLGDHFFNAIAANLCPVSVVAMGTDVMHDAGTARLSLLQRLLSRMGLRRAGSVSAKSRFVAAELARMGVRAPVEVNYWGCDLGRFQPGPRSAARSRLGLPDAAKIVLSPRAIQPLYNIDLIVEAFPAVLRRWPDALLLMVGRVAEQYQAKVAAMVERLGLAPHVRIIGNIGEAALADYFRASDLVVSVASSEGFPNTVLEAMACGIPVLVGDIPQIRELLTDGVNARICPITASGIEVAIGEMLIDPESAGRIAAAGRATAMESGDINRNGERWASELRMLAAGRKTQNFLSSLSYRLVLRVYQLMRFVGLGR